jgi:hypothetical protein
MVHLRPLRRPLYDAAAAAGITQEWFLSGLCGLAGSIRIVKTGGEVFASEGTVGKPGKPLEVRKDEDSITIVMLVARADNRASVRFVLRCEREGGIYASIEGKPWGHSAS